MGWVWGEGLRPVFLQSCACILLLTQVKYLESYPSSQLEDPPSLWHPHVCTASRGHRTCPTFLLVGWDWLGKLLPRLSFAFDLRNLIIHNKPHSLSIPTQDKKNEASLKIKVPKRPVIAPIIGRRRDFCHLRASGYLLKQPQGRASMLMISAQPQGV